jgi:hypothetical protein
MGPSRFHPYHTWHVIDYDFIRKQINELGDVFRIRQIAHDPWNATQLAVQLGGDGFQSKQALLHSGAREQVERLIAHLEREPQEQHMTFGRFSLLSNKGGARTQVISRNILSY